MKIKTLSQRSGVSVSTIKYYLREELLPAGFLTQINQAEYTGIHLQRLRLVQALCHIGGLSIAQISAILNLMQKPDYPMHELLGETMLSTQKDIYTTDEFDAALAEVDEFISRYQWKISPVSRARVAVASILATLHALGADNAPELLDRFGFHADVLAYAEDPAESAEQALIGAVIGDQLLIALRRLAEENVAVTSGKDKP